MGLREDAQVYPAPLLPARGHGAAAMADTVTFSIVFILSHICWVRGHDRLCLKTGNIRNPMMKYKIIKNKKWQDYTILLQNYFR